MQRYLFLGEETRLMKIVNTYYKHSWEHSDQTSSRYHKIFSFHHDFNEKKNTYFDLYD